MNSRVTILFRTMDKLGVSVSSFDCDIIRSAFVKSVIEKNIPEDQWRAEAALLTSIPTCLNGSCGSSLQPGTREIDPAPRRPWRRAALSLSARCPGVFRMAGPGSDYIFETPATVFRAAKMRASRNSYHQLSPRKATSSRACASVILASWANRRMTMSSGFAGVLSCSSVIGTIP